MKSRKLISFYNFMWEFIWIMLLCLPLICYAIYYFNDNFQTLTLVNMFNNFGFTLDTSNTVYTSLVSVFNYFGVTSASVVYFSIWIIFITVAHICTDLLIFLPRALNKLICRAGVDL